MNRALALLPLLITALAAAQTPYEIDDLYQVESYSAPVTTPDGSAAVSIRNRIDPATKESRASLWLKTGGKDWAAEPGELDARSPLALPDGSGFLFLSTRPRPEGWKQTPPTPTFSEPAQDLWFMPAQGGPAIPLAASAKPYGRVFADGFYGRTAFSPDGKRLVFVADEGKDPRSPEEIEADVIVVRPDQGEGYTGLGPAQIWVADLGEGAGGSLASSIQRVTTDDFWYGAPQWTPDGARIIVHANRTDDQESARYSINQNYDLWEIDLATKQLRQLTTGPGPEFSPRVSPDGKRVACLTSPRQGPHIDVFNLAIVTLEGTAEMKVPFNFRAPEVDALQTPSPSTPLPENCWMDDGRVRYAGITGLKQGEWVLDAETGKVSLAEPAPFADSVRPPVAPARPARLSASSQALTWDNGEGMRIEGVLVMPHPEISKPPYKLIVNPHGGPHHRAALGVGLDDQILAACGFAIFKPNFRGSTGYGLRFLDANRNDFGSGDQRDILSGVDHLVAEKLADPDRLFVYGVSYGGYMTSWLVGQTHRFKAAVAENAVTDLTMMWALSDLQSWTEWEFGGRPWEVPDAMRLHSPLTYVGKVKTPTLILHSRDDRRCPLPMGLAFHRALTSQGVPTEMVIYPGENHGIRQPKHRADKLRRILAWFER